MNPSRAVGPFGAALLAGLLFTCCAGAEKAAHAPARDGAAMKAAQSALTPGQALEGLRRGNERFLAGRPLRRDHLLDRRATAAGQYPAAIILGCIDSRAPAEVVFDAGIGDLFNARVAGNIVTPELVGSMEYACAASGSKLVLVMGHTHCGAIKGACDGVRMGNLTGLLQEIEPAVAAARNVPGEHTSKNHPYVEAVGEANVRLTMERIRVLSPILREMETQGRIMIAGCIYDLETGRVRFLAD